LLGIKPIKHKEEEKKRKITEENQIKKPFFVFKKNLVSLSIAMNK
jgi:hypothetical protein